MRTDAICKLVARALQINKVTNAICVLTRIELPLDMRKDFQMENYFLASFIYHAFLDESSIISSDVTRVTPRSRRRFNDQRNIIELLGIPG